jgi:hypothetical protein
MGADEGAAAIDPPAAGGERRIEEMPDMDHLGPDFEIDAHIGGTGGLGQAQRIVEQGLGGPDLDAKRARPERSA